eukprot:9483435-Pyramimonas_sp.AAC.3
MLHAKCWYTRALLQCSDILASDRCTSRALGAFQTYACQFGTISSKRCISMQLIVDPHDKV